MKAAPAGSRAHHGQAPEGGSNPGSLSVATNTSGADQAGVRLYNERLLLSLVRRFGPLSKIEVARLTGLSVQSTSAIMNRLQADGLLEARSAVARPRRAADDSDVDRPRRRLFLRAQDRTAQLRSRPDRLSRRCSPSRPPHLRLSDTGNDPRFRPLVAAVAGQCSVRRAEAADRRARRRGALPAVELGDGDRRADRRPERVAGF